MNSRQRVLNAIDHKVTDRVPIDFGGYQSGIHKKAYLNLIDYLDIKDDLKILDPIQQLALPCEELLLRLHADIRYIPTDNNSEHDNQGNYIDEFGATWSIPDEEHNYANIINHPLANASVKEIDNYVFPDEIKSSRFAGIREKALSVSNNHEYALSTNIGGSIFEISSNLRGIEQWFLDTKDNSIFCEALQEKVLAYWMDYYTDLLKEIGDIIDIVIIGDDLAGQNGPLFSMDFYRKILKPAQEQLISRIKSLSQAKICYHTCGSCSDFIPDLIDIGIDILNPLQIGLKNMDPQKVKKEFGKQISLWGGAMDAQHLLAFSNPEQIRREVQKNLEIFKIGGGFIFSNTHNIQFDVPAENIITLFDAAYEFSS